MANLPIGPHRIEAMLQHLLDLSKKMLEANGAFYPFGAIIDSSGNRINVTGDTGNPNSKTPEVYHLIRESMRLQYAKGEIIAGAIVAETNIPAELRPTYTDGVRILVESNSISRVIFLPYQHVSSPPPGAPAGTPHKFKFGELLGVDVKPSLFAAELN